MVKSVNEYFQKHINCHYEYDTNEMEIAYEWHDDKEKENDWYDDTKKDERW